MSLTATLETPACQDDAGAFRVILRITNRGETAASLLNPDLGAPPAEWPYSSEVYRAALLLSFGYLVIAVRDDSGQGLARQPIETWATPALRPRLALAPGASTGVAIPLAPFYALESGRAYEATVTYGEREARVTAQAHVTAP